MNCKPGDLVMVVGGHAKHLYGQVTRVVELLPGRSDPVWVIDPQLDTYWAGADKHLRPIRPQKGEDETLTWAGKPEQVTA
jgi:hypothetical protein